LAISNGQAEQILYLLFGFTKGPLVSKTADMVMSRDQDAGRSHSINTDSISLEKVEEFKYLVRTLTNQNSNKK
jgi:hypothetical protein